LAGQEGASGAASRGPSPPSDLDQACLLRGTVPRSEQPTIPATRKSKNWRGAPRPKPPVWNVERPVRSRLAISAGRLRQIDGLPSPLGISSQARCVRVWVNQFPSLRFFLSPDSRQHKTSNAIHGPRSASSREMAPQRQNLLARRARFRCHSSFRRGPRAGAGVGGWSVPWVERCTVVTGPMSPQLSRKKDRRTRDGQAAVPDVDCDRKPHSCPELRGRYRDYRDDFPARRDRHGFLACGNDLLRRQSVAIPSLWGH